MAKIRVQSRAVIDVGDWDQLIVDTYKRPYNLQQQNGCMDRQQLWINIPDDAEDYEKDTIPETVNHREMGVSFAAWLARDPNQPLNAETWKSSSGIEMWWERNFYPNIQMVANDLYAKGLIEAGEYYIDIDW